MKIDNERKTIVQKKFIYFKSLIWLLFCLIIDDIFYIIFELKKRRKSNGVRGNASFPSIVSLGKSLNLSDIRIADQVTKWEGVTNKFLIYRVVAKVPIPYRLD